MHEKQQAKLLTRITSNSEYLSCIDYIPRHQNTSNLNICNNTQKYLPISPNQNLREVCSITTNKMIVQMTYLLYTSSILETDIMLLCEPFYWRAQGSGLLQPRLSFYLANSERNIKMGENQIHKNKFIMMRATMFNQTICEVLCQMIGKVCPLLADKPLQQSLANSSLNKLVDFIKKYIQPKVMDSNTFKVIKLLQTTEVFTKNSDILLIHRSSLYYQIKKNKQVLEMVKNTVKNYQNRIFYSSLIDNSAYIFKVLDNFLFQLVNKQVIFLDKSSARFEKNADGLLVGFTTKVQEQGKEVQKFNACFFIPEKNQKQSQRQQKNTYVFEYESNASTILIRFISSLQATTESIDIISLYCANISFLDCRISMQTIDMIKNPSKNQNMRKYISFKSFFKLTKSEEPFTKILIIVEYVTVCAKIYVELMSKKPAKNQTQAIKEYVERLDHLMKMFVQRADCFYKNLFNVL